MRKGSSFVEFMITVTIILTVMSATICLIQTAEKQAKLNQQKVIERTTEVKSFMCFSTEKGMICRPVPEEKD